jgi:hypothetical protein
VNTAAALRAGTSRVTFATTSGPPAARLNGKPVASDTDPVALPGGVALRRLRDGWSVNWPDGSRVLVDPISIFGLLISVQPSDSRRGKLEGLLGAFDGSEGNDVQTADGMAVKPTDSKALYGPFRKSWLVTRRSSLFDYLPGQGTEAFDKPEIPDKPGFTVDDLPAKKRRTAERACRLAGVDQQPVLDDCILDVALSGRNEFASAAARLLAILENGGEAVSAPWEQIGPQLAAFSVMPSTTLVGSRPLVAWSRFTEGNVQSLSFDTSVTDAVSAPDARDVVSGWPGTGQKVALFAPPGGGTALLLTGTPPSPVDLKGWVSTLGGDGSWGQPVAALPGNFDDVAVLGGGGEPLFVQGRPGGSGLAAYHGFDPSGTTGTEVYDGSRVAVDPALGRDGTGAVWLAYRTIVSDALDGLYLRPLDPGTAAPLGPSVKAPGSEDASDRTGGPAPLVCAPGGGACRVVYTSTGAVGSKKILSWAPGEAAPTVVTDDAGDPAAVGAAYRADGRLWVAWLENDGTLRVVLGDGRGAGSPPMALGFATHDPDISRLVLQPVGDDVVLVANTASVFNGPRYLYVTHVAAP